MTQPVYETLLAELATGELTDIERKVFEALKAHPEGLRRQQLVAMVFGEVTRAGGVNNNNTKDRKIRVAISSLRARLYPIVSSSSRAGYKLDISADARKQMLREMSKRIDSLLTLNNRAAKFYDMPEFYRPVTRYRQGNLHE